VLAFAYWLTSQGLPPFKPDDSMSSVAASFLGPIIALLAGIAAIASYLVNLGSARATRFQKGVELLASPHSSVRTAGALMLRGVAREDPPRYAAIVLKTLQSFLFDNYAFRESYYPYNITPVIPAAGLRFGRSDSSVAEAFELAASLLPRVKKWEFCEPYVIGGKVPIAQIYIGGQDFVGADFSKCDIGATILHMSTFTRCDFRDSDLDFIPVDNVVFRDCDLRGPRVTVRHPWGEIAPQALHFTELWFQGKNTRYDSTTMINGMPFFAWSTASRTFAKPSHFSGSEISLSDGKVAAADLDVSHAAVP
jgi:hypothetical protein